MALQQFTRAEVAARGTERGALLVIDNAVYDVSGFLEEHPGGNEVLLHAVGGDATEDFEDIGHSPDARALMAKLLVGELVPADRVERARQSGGRSGAGENPLQSWRFLALLALAAALLYYYLLT